MMQLDVVGNKVRKKESSCIAKVVDHPPTREGELRFRYDVHVSISTGYFCDLGHVFCGSRTLRCSTFRHLSILPFEFPSLFPSFLQAVLTADDRWRMCSRPVIETIQVVRSLLCRSFSKNV
jgi:hypothetical protein